MVALVRFTESFSCQCGKVCKTKQGYAVHRSAAHGATSAARWYGGSDGLCRACGMNFSSRQLLCNHLRAGSPLCLLGLLLRVPHFSDEEELEHTEATKDLDRRLKSTRKAGASVTPAFRRPWVPWQFIDLNGAFVGLCDKRHPCRTARVQYGWNDGVPGD